MARLEGKVAIVAGSATGIGASTARAFAREGARVVLGDINLDGARSVADEIVAGGGEAVAQGCDISEERQVAELIERTISTYGRLHVLANIAAALGQDVIGEDSRSDVLRIDTSIFDRTIAVNLRGFLLTMKHAVPRMLEAGGGSIINTSSTAALATEPIRGAYATSKAAIIGLSNHVATAYGKRGIRVNVVAPGKVVAGSGQERPRRFEAFEGIDPDSKEYHEMMLSHHLTPYLGTYEDIAHVFVFLASDESRFMTGSVLRVDGGLLTPFPSHAEVSSRSRGA